MYQAIVYSVSSGKLTKREFDSRERAAGNLAVLMRLDSHEETQAALTARLVSGETITHHGFMYWVQETP